MPKAIFIEYFIGVNAFGILLLRNLSTIIVLTHISAGNIYDKNIPSLRLAKSN